MKIKRIISSAILMSAITLGIGIATNNNSKKETSPVEATGTTKTLYINHFDGGGSWNNFSYYLFGGSYENAPWPGVAFTDSMKTSTPNEFDQYQYKLDIDTSLYQYLILVGNPSGWSGTQAKTEDLTLQIFQKMESIVAILNRESYSMLNITHIQQKPCIYMT